MLSHPWYAVIVIAHVLSGIVAFGALGMTGIYARLVQSSDRNAQSDSVRRYFAPGTNWAARSLYLVPIFGGLALGFSHDTHKIYPYLGLGIWLVATGVASAMMWPAEAKIQRLIKIQHGSKDGDDMGELARAAIACERGATLTTLCFVAALVVMIAQPN